MPGELHGVAVLFDAADAARLDEQEGSYTPEAAARALLIHHTGHHIKRLIRE
jgi:hypothetical protein